MKSVLPVLPTVLMTLAALGASGEGAIAQSPGSRPSGGEVLFALSARTVDRYDFVEVAVRVTSRPTGNPFVDASVSGEFGLATKGEKLKVEGFCDSEDGTLFRIRFMPGAAGEYSASVTYRGGGLERTWTGAFTAREANRRGPLRVDPKYPWHFLWEGTGEHYFLNGTTAFLLMGWEDEKIIDGCINRLAGLSVNRIRVLLDGRSDHFWTEPIKPGKGFRAHLNPWIAQRPDDVNNPGFDYVRFNVAYWQKFERMLKRARDRDVVISAVLGWNDTKARPVAGSEDERRYFHYAAVRLGAFSNINWDVGDDCDSFRTEACTHDMGLLIHEADPYHHLSTSHPVDNGHQDRKAEWFGFTSFQQWGRPLHDWMLSQRAEQAKTGRIIPQVNEEYGYEDHYPSWAPYKPPGANADADRRAAWEMSMAGCYQTTGETAKRGTGVPPDAGGGWVNGRGDDTMTMLKGYAHMVRFFTALEWWKADPHDELVNNGAFCLAEKGRLYVVYLPHGGNATVTLDRGHYDAQWFNPRTGKYSPLPAVEGHEWTSPAASDKEDWVLLFKKAGA